MNISEFSNRLTGLAAELSEVSLPVEMDNLREFCRVTGHDFSSYENSDRLPAGYLLTFADPLASQLIVNFFVKFPSIIKGVIHTGSRVEYYEQMRPSRGPYIETVRVDKVVEKQGGKGRYFVVDFEVEVKDREGVKSASDFHQFFLKV